MDYRDYASVPSNVLYNYRQTCWWCGKAADTGEHKWLRAEVVALYGVSAGLEPLVWGNGVHERHVQGANSGHLKFAHTLCSPCNNSRSQPFDRAYLRYATFVIGHHDRLLRESVIDFSEVFGDSLEQDLLNLGRYFAKHIACRIAQNGAKVPENLIRYLDAEEDLCPSVYSQFGSRLAGYTGRERADARYFGLRLGGSFADYDENALLSFKSYLALGAVEFLYDVNLDPATPNIGNGILEGAVQLLHLHRADTFREPLFGVSG